MFTMAKIKNGGTYLSHHLTANDYYCENETVIGQWVGRGAEKLNLHGEIRAGDPAFECLRNNWHPDGPGKLTPRDGGNRVKFFDFQCSAQKVGLGHGRHSWGYWERALGPDWLSRPPRAVYLQLVRVRRDHPRWRLIHPP